MRTASDPLVPGSRVTSFRGSMSRSSRLARIALLTSAYHSSCSPSLFVISTTVFSSLRTSTPCSGSTSLLMATSDSFR